MLLSKEPFADMWFSVKEELFRGTGSNGPSTLPVDLWFHQIGIAIEENLETCLAKMMDEFNSGHLVVGVNEESSYILHFQSVELLIKHIQQNLESFGIYTDSKVVNMKFECDPCCGTSIRLWFTVTDDTDEAVTYFHLITFDDKITEIKVSEEEAK